jgi:predicted HicB family RNase H-like nuclease
MKKRPVIYLRVPAVLKRAVKCAAKSEGLSVNEWVKRLLERQLSKVR